ncbi:MAG: BatD family protein [Pseudomonadota bacterium]
MVRQQGVILGVFFLLTTAVFANNASLTVDQTNVEKDQTFTAVFTYKGQLETEPDFSALEEDFAILSQGLSNSVEIINGNYREQKSWNMVLLPKKEGALTLPPITFGNDQSNAVTINVSPPKPRSNEDLGDLFLETELTPEGGGYVQQQHLFTVRIFYRGWLLDGQLSDPQLDDQDVVVQSMGEPRRYSVTRNGERYQVYERRHALFPQASGDMLLGETTFSGRIRLPEGGNRLKSVASPAIQRTVKPVPAAFTGDTWLPAEAVSITDIWPNDNLAFEQGVPISRTITLAATGLTSAQLPALKLEGSEALRVYPDQPTAGDRVGEKGVLGSRTTTVALVPQTAGDVALAPITIKWWDTVDDRERTATLAARTLSVLAAPGVAQSSDAPVTTRAVPLHRNHWFYATVACALGWLLTLMVTRKRRTSDTVQTLVPAPDAFEQQLKRACDAHDAKTCLALLNTRLRASPDSERGLTRAQRDALRAPLKALNEFLYGPQADRSRHNWQGGADIWAAFQAVNPTRSKPAAPLASLAAG